MDKISTGEFVAVIDEAVEKVTKTSALTEKSSLVTLSQIPVK